MIHWLLHTRGGLLARLVAGVVFFLVLVVVDVRKNGRAARRWREYGFLLFCVAVAVVYGAIND